MDQIQGKLVRVRVNFEFLRVLVTGSQLYSTNKKMNLQALKFSWSCENTRTEHVPAINGE